MCVAGRRIVGRQKPAHAVGQAKMGLDLMGENAVGEIGAHQQCPAAVLAVEHRTKHFAEHPPACPHRAQHADHKHASRGARTPRGIGSGRKN